MSRWIKLFFVWASMSFGVVGALEPQPGYTGKELCAFTRTVLDHMKNTEDLHKVLAGLEKTASAGMQPIIADLIVVLQQKGMDAFVSDLGRRVKMGAENEEVGRKDLVEVTQPLDEKFGAVNCHRGMMQARADKNYFEALYYYLKIAEKRCPSQESEPLCSAK